ncbi:universal stress protein PHOS32-like isoform X1 [Sesbania bispinosa]|nr:universal stress protein PHOS32-like isoform X1 [Sesbania bispinosa]
MARRPENDDFNAFMASKVGDLAKLLRDTQTLYKIHIVKDHDKKQLSGTIGLTIYCVCPIIVVRYPNDKDGEIATANAAAMASKKEKEEETVAVPPHERKKGLGTDI